MGSTPIASTTKNRSGTHLPGRFFCWRHTVNTVLERRKPRAAETAGRGRILADFQLRRCAFWFSLDTKQGPGHCGPARQHGAAVLLHPPRSPRGINRDAALLVGAGGGKPLLRIKRPRPGGGGALLHPLGGDVRIAGQHRRKPSFSCAVYRMFPIVHKNGLFTKFLSLLAIEISTQTFYTETARFAVFHTTPSPAHRNSGGFSLWLTALF